MNKCPDCGDVFEEEVLGCKSHKKRGDCCEKCFKWGEQYGQYVFPCNNEYCFCHVPKDKEL